MGNLVHEGFFVFSDRGGDRIERLQLGGETDLAQECAAYDRFGDPDELRALVEERDPARIGLNYLAVPYESEGLHIADGLTLRLQVPAARTRREVRGNGIGGTERVIQRGDVLQIDWGADRNNFTTDIKRFAYVLREGETAPPPGVLNAFAETKKVQEIIRKHVRPGRTGREQLDELKQLIRHAGYVYTEAEAISDVPGIEVNVEENVLITERGIEWLYPPQARVLVIR